MCPPATHLGLSNIFLRSPSLHTLLTIAIISPPVYIAVTSPYPLTTFLHSHTKLNTPPSITLLLRYTQHSTAKCLPFHLSNRPPSHQVTPSYTTTPFFTSLPTAYTNHTIITLLDSSTHSIHLHL